MPNSVGGIVRPRHKDGDRAMPTGAACNPKQYWKKTHENRATQRSRRDLNLDRHVLKRVGHTEKAAGDRHDETDIAADRHGDQIVRANPTVGRIEGDPTRTG